MSITEPAAVSESDSNFPFKENQTILISEHYRTGEFFTQLTLLNLPIQQVDILKVDDKI